MSLVLNSERLVARRPKQSDQHVQQPQTSLQRLSSGLRINSAADDPAGLVISEQQGAQIAGLQAAIQNTTTATTLVQTADGALSTINNLLAQIRGLAVSSANSGVNDANSLAANQAQIANALSTIDRIAANTQFGTKNLLDGSAGITGTTDNANVSFLNAANHFANRHLRGGRYYRGPASQHHCGNGTDGRLGRQRKPDDQRRRRRPHRRRDPGPGDPDDQPVLRPDRRNGPGGRQTGATQLYSTQYGSAAKISVQSNVAAGATSSGFGVSQVNAQGVDVAGTIGGFAASGSGNVLTGTSGAGAAGISVSLGLAAGSQTPPSQAPRATSSSSTIRSYSRSAPTPTRPRRSLSTAPVRQRSV